jgi:hypothetical protein
MKKHCFLLLFVFLSSSFFSHNLFSWGFFGHKRINRLSVFTLPDGMIQFYKVNIEYITENAVGPDKRRYSVKEEGARHYIDIDHYADISPFDSVPRKWKDAVEKFSEDTLQAYGIVPWHIDIMVQRLSGAFRNMNVDRILRLSADLGHYVGDAHVPLHTTLNYNGQMTNQKGIHGFWESRLPELYSDNYDFFVGKATYIEDPLETAWQIAEASFRAKDSVLNFEANLNTDFPSDKKYSYEEKGQQHNRVYSREYSDSYHKNLNGMVERRMRESIKMVGSYWYTAWVNAGKPDLDKLIDGKLTKEMEIQLKEEEKMWKAGKIYGRNHPE